MFPLEKQNKKEFQRHDIYYWLKKLEKTGENSFTNSAFFSNGKIKHHHSKNLNVVQNLSIYEYTLKASLKKTFQQQQKPPTSGPRTCRANKKLKLKISRLCYFFVLFCFWFHFSILEKHLVIVVLECSFVKKSKTRKALFFLLTYRNKNNTEMTTCRQFKQQF